MKKTLTTFLFCQLALSLFSQQKYTISGFIEDAASSERLISAAVVDLKSAEGIVTNTYGFYSLTLPKGAIQLTISYVGYNTQDTSFTLEKDMVMNFRLKPTIELQAVEISAKKQNRIENQTQMSQVTVPIEQIKKVPALLGEVDVLKVLQLLPGVQGGGEGQNGLYVRGGSPDQNLILLDGVPVYNVSHLGGFFSVFNGDAIKNVTLTKGGFPARYGGRLSSIIEINMKEGNMKEFHGEGGIGIIASRLTLEGPIIKDKMSFMVSGRRTYLDVIARPIIKAAIKSENSSNSNYNTSVGLDAHFYDLNAKINYIVNDKHRLFLSAYNGIDIFGMRYDEIRKDGKGYEKSKGGFDWGNLTTAFRWNWLINNKLFANTTLTYSRYNVNILAQADSKRDTIVEGNYAKYLSGIKDWGGKMDFDYIVNPQHRLRFGFGGTYHTYEPGAFQLQSKSVGFKLDTTLGSNATYSFEPYAYVEDDLQLGALKANVGLHFSGFSVQKEFYTSIQPRIGLNYPLSNDLALKASFTTMRQYINLLTNERIGLPTDLWVPATKRIKPQDAWQAGIGLAKTFKSDYEVSLEGYYKGMSNVISYRDGANFININSNWEDKITQGKGKAYGAEFLVQKKEGKTTGWIGYTLSWNTRQFSDLNNGLEYPFKYDRRHDFEILVTHQFSKRFTLSGTWQYGTGNAVSLPTALYKLPQTGSNLPINLSNGNFNNIYFQDYEIINGKNDFRMPAYHRMDVNFEFTKKKKHYTRTWVFGAYNMYSRANPMFLMLGYKSIEKDGQYTSERVIRQFSLFPIVPHFAWNFKF
jgi:hypothetical protein